MTDLPWTNVWSPTLVALAGEILGSVATAHLEEPHAGFALRLVMNSRSDAPRRATVNMHSEWAEVVFETDPRLGVLRLDDFEKPDAHAMTVLRDLLLAAREYLTGGGTLTTRRTVLGRRRTTLTLESGTSKWQAHEPLFRWPIKH